MNTSTILHRERRTQVYKKNTLECFISFRFYTLFLVSTRTWHPHIYIHPPLVLNLLVGLFSIRVQFTIFPMMLNNYESCMAKPCSQIHSVAILHTWHRVISYYICIQLYHIELIFGPSSVVRGLDQNIYPWQSYMMKNTEFDLVIKCQISLYLMTLNHILYL